MTTTITSHAAAVLDHIDKGDFQVIGIGEIHNSRSAIKFIMDNLNRLAPATKKTYFLSELLPPDLFLKKTKSNAGKYLKAKLHLGFGSHLSQREVSRKSPNEHYTLDKLYEAVFERGIEIHSIEEQNKESKELYARIQKGDLEAFNQRIVQINKKVFEVYSKLPKEANIRIIFLAGMCHITGGTCHKFNKEKFTESKKAQGFLPILSANASCVSILIHDPELIRNEVAAQACDGISFLAENDDVAQHNKPDFFLLLHAEGSDKKQITDSMESVFLPGEPNFDTIKNYTS